jgi:hypothetical protein
VFQNIEEFVERPSSRSMAGTPAANLQVEKVSLQALVRAQFRTSPTGRGMPAQVGYAAAQRRPSRSLSVSFRRTDSRSDGGSDIDAGMACGTSPWPAPRPCSAEFRHWVLRAVHCRQGLRWCHPEERPNWSCGQARRCSK